MLGVCGSGGFGLAAAEIDPRIKAVATVSMYDIGQAKRQGLAATLDEGALRKTLDDVAAQRWAEVDGAERDDGDRHARSAHRVVDGDRSGVLRLLSHPARSASARDHRVLAHERRADDAVLVVSASRLDAPRPVLFITGDQAHSRIFSEHAHSRASEPKELFIVPGAGHVDLYDRVDLIPWDKLQSFFGKHLAGAKARS